MRKEKLIFIESHINGGTGRKLVQDAFQKGFLPVIFAKNPSLYKYIEEDNLEVFQVDTSDESTISKKIRELSTTSKIVGITSCLDFYLQAAANLASCFSLHGPNPDVLRTCNNKYAQRLRLKSQGVSVPIFYMVTSGQEAVSAAEIIGFPVIVKPINLSGSRGVKFCRDSGEVENHTKFLLDIELDSHPSDSISQVLVEEAVEGSEYSVEIFGKEIIGVTRKYLGSLPYFVELGHDFPAVFSDEKTERRIKDFILEVLSALNWEIGPAHIELRTTESGPVAIEINPRLGGDYISDLIFSAFGIDLVSQTVSFITGSEVTLEKTKSHYASVRFIPYLLEGTVKSIEGVAFAKQVYGVSEVKIYHYPGHSVCLHGDYRDRAGHVISCGDTFESVRDSAELSSHSIEIIIE
ncbi:ATP-grasp domain-containing protein [Romeria aff. gracilis LEGE 07310]|uniref:ATP-grasp domain-containing protein n=1 Tax=Vasconcelosia minhoensis LEGE 07310 TaxID=915328 RepID=A0A8J7ATN9_9CYAN|nr:ATP-grasp domain-containing protein [Romeria gracilis]MBE9080385.1 ATP-grasp domain-containing protein [Romeria aff. gracilis LEGE 07310]